MTTDPATRWDKTKAWTYVLILPVILFVLAGLSWGNGHAW